MQAGLLDVHVHAACHLLPAAMKEQGGPHAMVIN
jgi:hypothetical protein